jgi:hypothetical protein
LRPLSLGGTIVTISHTRRAGMVLLAGAALLLMDPVTAATEQASSTETFNPVPLLFIAGGVMLAAALTWFVRAVPAAVARTVPRRRP